MDEPSCDHTAVASVIGVGDIQAKAAAAAFGKPLITNVHRGLIAEAIVACALEPDWSWCSADYASWDFERSDGLRLEVKQSAARQSWAVDNAIGRASFDVAARVGRYEGTRWIPEPERPAHLYVFAHHVVADASADHRDPAQWRFYVSAASELPPVKRIALGPLQKRTTPVAFSDLKSRVAAVAAELKEKP